MPYILPDHGPFEYPRKDRDWVSDPWLNPKEPVFPYTPKEKLQKLVDFYREAPDKINTDGGPSDYYNFPKSWTTFNDFIEYKSEYQWKKFSFHLGNIGKALCRWGDKDGTSVEYDARKIIYSGVRVLKMIVGIKATREYLQRLLDDPQFKED